MSDPLPLRFIASVLGNKWAIRRPWLTQPCPQCVFLQSLPAPPCGYKDSHLTYWPGSLLWSPSETSVWKRSSSSTPSSVYSVRLVWDRPRLSRLGLQWIKPSPRINTEGVLDWITPLSLQGQGYFQLEGTRLHEQRKVGCHQREQREQSLFEAERNRHWSNGHQKRC